jgi:hypothetical protein
MYHIIERLIDSMEKRAILIEVIDLTNRFDNMGFFAVD